MKGGICALVALLALPVVHTGIAAAANHDYRNGTTHSGVSYYSDAVSSMRGGGVECAGSASDCVANGVIVRSHTRTCDNGPCTAHFTQ